MTTPASGIGVGSAHRFTSFLLHSGLSFFYISSFRPGEESTSSLGIGVGKNKQISFATASHAEFASVRNIVPFARGIAQQLLALRYGRRELHPAPLPLFDDRLDDTGHEFQFFVEQLISMRK